MAISFKSVGKTKEDVVAESLTKSPTPIGIKTPIQLGTEHIFAVNYSLADQVHDNFRNLVLTNWGERLGLYNFGANLRPLTTEFVSQDDFDGSVMERVSTATQRWMPYISLESYESSVDRHNNKNTAIIKLTIVYSVQALSIKHKSLEVTLNVI